MAHTHRFFGRRRDDFVATSDFVDTVVVNHPPEALRHVVPDVLPHEQSTGYVNALVGFTSIKTKLLMCITPIKKD